MPSSIDGEMLRSVMRHVPSPVTVVTAAAPDDARGITIGSFTSVSLDPALISFNVEKAAQMHALITQADRFAVHILREDQADLSNHFAIPDLPGTMQFQGVAHRRDTHGTPLLDGALAILHCRPHAFHDAGDHTLVLGEVLAIDQAEDGTPLVYFDRTYRSIGEAVEWSLFSPVKRASSETP